MKPTAALLAIILALILSSAACAPTVAIAPSVDLGGRWTGECNGCVATGFTLVLSQKGPDITGTINVTGTRTFGDGEKPILKGKVAGRTVTFQVRGDPGDVFDVDLTASADGTTMEGFGYYGSSFGLGFTRTSQ